MGKKYQQMSILDTYKSVEERLENNKAELFVLLDEHLDWEEIIPARFYSAFYRRLGRRRSYGLESFLRALFLQRIFHYVEDSQLLNTLRFSEMQIEKRTNHPDVDKEIGDSTPLKPVLLDFKKAHPTFHYSVFSADSAFDSYDNFTFLLKNYGFQKAIVLLNPRRGLPADDAGFNENGTPLCPADGTPLKPCGHANEKHRSPRLKFICPKSKIVKPPVGGRTYRCQCETPCSSSKYGRCVYVPLNKNLRLYPGISRDDPSFALIYNRRTCVERSINSLKDTLGISNRKTSNVLTTKADLFLAGIVQLLCVLLAYKLHDMRLARRPRKLIA